MRHRQPIERKTWLAGDVADNAGLIETALRENRVVILRTVGGQLTIQVTRPQEAHHDKPEHHRTDPLRSQRIPGRRR